VIKEECKGGKGDFLEGDDETEEEEILERSGAPQVPICGENEFPNDKEKNFQGSKEGKISKEGSRNFPLKAEEEGDEDGENKDGAVNQ
jgi:hypothetical protein